MTKPYFKAHFRRGLFLRRTFDVGFFVVTDLRPGLAEAGRERVICLLGKISKICYSNKLLFVLLQDQKVLGIILALYGKFLNLVSRGSCLRVELRRAVPSVHHADQAFD